MDMTRARQVSHQSQYHIPNPNHVMTDQERIEINQTQLQPKFDSRVDVMSKLSDKRMQRHTSEMKIMAEDDTAKSNKQSSHFDRFLQKYSASKNTDWKENKGRSTSTIDFQKRDFKSKEKIKYNDFNFGTFKTNYHTIVQHEQNLLKFKEPLFKKFGR